jgi:hypothetical protein
MRWTGHIAGIGRKMHTKTLVGKPEGKILRNIWTYMKG